MPEPVLSHSNMHCCIFSLGRWNVGMVCMRLALLAKCSELSRRSYKVLILQQQGKDRERVGKTYFNKKKSRKQKNSCFQKYQPQIQTPSVYFRKNIFIFAFFLLKKSGHFHTCTNMCTNIFSPRSYYFSSPLSSELLLVYSSQEERSFAFAPTAPPKYVCW